MKPRLLCILGETASGKDSIVNGAIKKLSDYNLRLICSYTDRPKRDNETDGVEHYFVTTEEFQRLKEERKHEILAYTHIKKKNQDDHPGYYYMAFTDELNTAQLYIIDYQGLLNLQKIYGDMIEIITIYIHTPLVSRLRRAQASRSDFQQEFEARVKAEEEQFSEFKRNHLYDYKIENKDGKMENAINQMAMIIERELIRSNVPNSPMKTAIKNK